MLADASVDTTTGCTAGEFHLEVEAQSIVYSRIVGGGGEHQI